MAQLWPDQRLHFDSRAIFIPDMGSKENNVAMVMSHSDHKSLGSLKIHLPPQHTDCIRTDRRIKSVGLFLASFAGTKGISGTQGTAAEKGKSLEKQDCGIIAVR